MSRVNIANETAAVTLRGNLNLNFIELFKHKPEKFCGYFDNAGDIQLYENSEGFTAIDNFYAIEVANQGKYKFDKDSVAVHDGINVIQPTNIEGSDPGRWILISVGELPSSIPAASITETSEKQFVTAAEKAKYDEYEEQIQSSKGSLFLTLAEIKALTSVPDKLNVVNINNGNLYKFYKDSTSEPDDLNVIKTTEDIIEGRFHVLATGIISIQGTPKDANTPVSINGMKMFDSEYEYISAGDNKWHKISLTRF